MNTETETETDDTERLDDNEFRVLLNLVMVSDPWPLSDDNFAVIENRLMVESHGRGFESYPEAYHEFEENEA